MKYKKWSLKEKLEREYEWQIKKEEKIKSHCNLLCNE